ncbi:nuclear pore complex protein Nup50 [Lycorma delicatula]|uniref:nuclear pore complex protein Nup50 n=1 Tax=Lycorma delicatula TaxID=130591 RepID=UPI003F51863A
MAKRGATSELNHENWDREDEPEVAGTFQKASNDTMQKRIFKVAKRRSTGQVDQGSSKNVFSSFYGFNTDKPPMTSSADVKSTFSFLNNSATSPTSNGIQDQPQSSLSASVSSSNAFINTTTATQISSVNDSDDCANSKKYPAKLIRLNQCVADWIKTHVDKDPSCILTPVFRDYERYLMEIEEERKNSTTKDENLKDSNINSGSSTKNNLVSAINVAASNFKFKRPSGNNSGSTSNLDNIIKSSESGSNNSSAHSLFSSFKNDAVNKAGGISSLLAKPDPASLMINPFVTKLNQDSTAKSESDNTAGSDKSQQAVPTTSGFSLGSGSVVPFNKTDSPGSSMNDKSKEGANNNNTTDGEPNDYEEPPKADFTPIQEKDSVYNKRCKVFIKKEANYADLGVGTLFIKPVTGERHQLIVRADTSLGNILVNVILNKAIPMQRMGKNNVMVICVPTPPAAGSKSPQTPSTVLLRVKTSEEADELLKILKKYKKL